MKPPKFDSNWTEDVKALYRHDIQEIWDSSICPNVWNQYHNQLDIYQQLVSRYFPNKVDILDVGCAQATLAMLLAEAGHRVCAVDLRPSFLEYAQSRYTHGDIRFVQGNALEFSLKEHFDLIFANQIIEHLVYPERLITNLKQRLKPHGILVITTPNWHYLKNDLPSFIDLGDRSQYEHRQHTADGDGHFFAYRADELKALIAAAGLELLDTIYFESPIIAGHLKTRYLHQFLRSAVLHSVDRLILLFPQSRYLAHQCLITARLP